MAKKKVVRITRHKASEAQIAELQRLYGTDVEVVTINESMPTNTREFTARFDELAEDATVVEAVLPLNLMEAALKFTKFVKSGGSIIRSVMNREVDDDGNAKFTFDHYEKVVKVEITTERL